MKSNQLTVCQDWSGTCWQTQDALLVLCLFLSNQRGDSMGYLLCNLLWGLQHMYVFTCVVDLVHVCDHDSSFGFFALCWGERFLCEKFYDVQYQGCSVICLDLQFPRQGSTFRSDMNRQRIPSTLPLMTKICWNTMWCESLVVRFIFCI